MSATKIRGETYVVGAAAGLILVLGWRAFWFLCDDAFIAFRYVSNHYLGRGWVWNPDPFRAVEGYTSFLWVSLLDLTWRVTGLPPTETANPLLLGFSLGSVLIVTLCFVHLPLSERLRPLRLFFMTLGLAGTVCNPSFLAWTSSGLEQGMFTFWLLAWIYVGLIRPADPYRLPLLSWLGVALALTRPEGILYVFATVAYLVWQRKARLWAWIPFAIPVLHVAWRWSFYGYPLPNTYYAKSTGMYPLTGLRYLGSFLLEHAYWIFLLVALVAAVRYITAAGYRGILSRPRTLLVGPLLFQAAWYTFAIGGDHFEYRIYHHLIPLIWIALPWLLDRIDARPWAARTIVTAMLGAGMILPWGFWLNVRDLQRLPATGFVETELAPTLPRPLRWYARPYDEIQFSLRSRFVGLRWVTHKLFLEQQVRDYPGRDEGSTVAYSTDDVPVFVHGNVGYPGWVLPNVAVIDYLGLNDAVIARNPVAPGNKAMAHQRFPPDGYLACFRQNVGVEEGRITLFPRESPLTADAIRDCEQRFLDGIR